MCVQVNGVEPASEEEQQRAAVKIQAGIRGYRDRQRVKALRSAIAIFYTRLIEGYKSFFTSLYLEQSRALV